MTKKLDVARAVAAQLYVTENAVDDAIRQAARLTLAVTDARGDLNLAAVVGGGVFDRAAALHGGLALARAEAASLHEELAGVRDLLRIRMDAGSGFGPDFGNPDKPTGVAQTVEAPRVGAPDEPAARRLRTV